MKLTLNTRAWRALEVVVLAGFACAPATAQAALSITLVGGDALEERPMTFVASGTTDATNDIWASLRLSGGVPCAPSHAADAGGNLLFFGEPSGTQEIETVEEPGAYVVCAYLASDFDAVPVERFTLPVNVRPNNASIAIQAPVRGVQDMPTPVTLAGTTELGRQLFARAKPVGSGPCGQSMAADPSSGTFAYAEPALGTFGVPRLAGPFSEAGRYTLCAWVQEHYNDVVAEAGATAVIDIVPPIPVLRSLTMSPSAFAPQPSGGFVTSGLLSSSSISYRLENTKAAVRLTISARRTGRRVGSSCRTLTPANRRRPRCVRYQRIAGSYTDAGTRGTNYVRFSGRVGGRRLKVGAYRLSATPRTTTGPGITRHRLFRVIRSR